MRVANANRNRASRMNNGYSVKIEAEGAAFVAQNLVVGKHCVNEYSVSDINLINLISFFRRIIC